MMTFKDLALAFNRSWTYAFGVKKFFALFGLLLLSGLIYLFFQGVALYTLTPWIKAFLQGFPLFLIVGIIMGSGVGLIGLYAREREGEHPPFKQTLWSISPLLLKASYVALPLLLLFVIFWVLIGIFILLKAIPYVGMVLGVILAFAPFLLNLGILLLLFAVLLGLFFLVPSLTLTQELNQMRVFQRIRSDLFIHLVLLGVAFIPVWIVWKFVVAAAVITLEVYGFGEGPLERLLQLAFMLIPIAALLTPVVAFFFNFACEAYLKEINEENQYIAP